MSTTAMNILAHLKSRDCDTNLHVVWVSEQEGTAVFPLWNLSGVMVGYQQYRPFASKKKNNHPSEGKYFTYTKKHCVYVWGLESFHLTPNHLFVTEGIFDATRLTKRGASAIAVLSNDPTISVRNWLSSINRTVTVVADNDSAGKKLIKVGNRSVIVPHGDLGDAAPEWVDNLVSEYI